MEIAFVAGATGYTGRAVVRLLCESGVETWAHIRPGSSSAEKWEPKFQEWGAHVDRTAWEDETMRKRLQELQPTLVFGLLGTTRSKANEAKKRGERADYETVDYGLTAMLIRAAHSADCEPRFVYLSSLGAREGGGAYLEARWKVESMLQEIEQGLTWTIARPSFITGEGREENRVGERVGAAVADTVLGALGALGARSLRDRYQSMDNTELGAGLVRCALDPSCAGSILEADELRGGPEALRTFLQPRT